MYDIDDRVEAGGLMSYSADDAENYRRAAKYRRRKQPTSRFTISDIALTCWHKMKVPLVTAMLMAGQSSIQSFKKYINMDAQVLPTVYGNPPRILQPLE
jgi:hypothetical protein